MLSIPPKVVALIVGIPTTALLLYWLFGEKEDDEDQEKNKNIATSRQTVIEVKVPGKAAGAIIGRQGANIKEIQKKSGARVNFQDDHQNPQSEESERTVVIRGMMENAQAAELLIREAVANIPKIETETINVPSRAIGRIIGRGGDTVRSIYRTSKARVFVDRTKQDYREVDRQIQITGTREQIDLAKTLIAEKVQEEEVFRAKQAVMEANREKRSHSQNKQESKTVKTPGTPDPLNILPPFMSDKVSQNSTENLSSSSNNSGSLPWPSGREYVEVYVSSVANPSTFWVQILSSNSVQLDELVAQMTLFYSSEDEQNLPDTVSVGDIVAAPFDMDSSWYRAKVMGIQDSNADVLYLDYGDSTYLDKSRLCTLSPNFLKLPFQAIECELSGIIPTGSGANNDWSEAAVDRFEELTYSAKWKVLMAKRVGAKKLASGDVVQIVELIDTNSEKDVNIGKQLVHERYA
ncbi:hypothetical protein FSP39_012233 [Pinctada imbricata]|uniref:Tudor domain-containing protein n=1 Tax=Pinctada imbricata TaxID=66713 RepID=A0AA89C1A2_PINIB|nr:hypothetical protein FSP39_012233 [Pinctada imbricata]